MSNKEFLVAHIGVFHCCNTFLYLNWFLHCCFSTSKLSKAGLVCLEEERVKVRMQFYYHFKISKYIKVLSLTCVNQYDLDVYTHLRDIKSLRKVFLLLFFLNFEESALPTKKADISLESLQVFGHMV